MAQTRDIIPGHTAFKERKQCSNNKTIELINCPKLIQILINATAEELLVEEQAGSKPDLQLLHPAKKKKFNIDESPGKSSKHYT